MATPTLDAYRQLNPTDTRSDDQILPDLIGQLQNQGTLSQYPDLIQAAQAANRAHAPSLDIEARNALFGGTDQAIAQLYNTTAQGADAFGLPSLKDWALKGYNERVQDASEYSPTVPTVQDIHNPMDALRYGIGLAGQQAPGVAGMMAATGAGALIGSAVGPEGTAPGALEGAEAALAAAKATGSAVEVLRATKAVQALTAAGSGSAALGGTAGAFGAGYVQSQNYAQLMHDHAQDALLTSAAIGTAGGLLMTVVPSTILRKSFGAESSDITHMTMEQVLAKAETEIPGISTYLASHIAEHGANGAVLGAAQEIVSIGGEYYAHRDDPTFDISGKEIAQRIINGATAGGVLGGTMAVLSASGGKKGDENVQNFAQKLKAMQEKVAQDNADTRVQQQTAGLSNFWTPNDSTAGVKAGPYSQDEMDSAGISPVDQAAMDDPKNVARGLQEMQYYDMFDKRAVENSQGGDRTAFEDYKQYLASQETKAPEPTVPAASKADIVPNSNTADTKMPDWAREEMVRQGLDPARPLNDADVANPSIRDAVLSDPTLTSEQKANVLATGSPKVSTTEVLGEVHEPLPPMEHAGDLPEPGPQYTPRTVVQDQLPPLRQEVTMLKKGTTPEEAQTQALNGVRKNEGTEATTKRYMAVRDNKTGEVRIMGVYDSTDHQPRLINEVEARDSDHDVIARLMGVTPKELRQSLKGTSPADIARQKVYSELRHGVHGNQFFDEFFSEKVGNKRRYDPIAFIDGLEQVGGKEHVFKNEDQFRQAVNEVYVPAKNSVGLDNKGIDHILKKVDELAPEEGHAVRVFASLLESLPQLQTKSTSREGLSRQQLAIQSNTNAIMNGLLDSPKREVFLEALHSAKNAQQFFSVSKGRLFGLFTPKEWDEFKLISQEKSVSGATLLSFLDRSLKDAGFSTRAKYLDKVATWQGLKESGVQYNEATNSGAKIDENDESTIQEGLATAEGGAAGIADQIASDSSKSSVGVSAPEEAGLRDEAPSIAQAVTGLTDQESSILHRWMSDTKEGQWVREARADSEISNPTDDLEFKEVEPQLTAVLKRIFTELRADEQMPKDFKSFVYGVYSNIDKTSKDSRPSPTTYRVTTNAIDQRFRGTVNYLSDLGVDTNLIEQNMASSVEFLRNEWGRAISATDGQRMIVLSMTDVREPSQENLRVLLHETAHQLFTGEKPWVQRLMHEAIERLSDTQQDVFSKTRDARIAAGNPENLTQPELMGEVLAEHLSFYGLEQTAARSLGQKIVDGFTKVMAQAALLIGKLRGVVYAPELIQRYAEIRMSEFIDGALNSKTDLDALTGNVRDMARYTATFYRGVDGDIGVEHYDPESGNFVIRDVINNSKLAALFNLDNKLQYSDMVVSDARPRTIDSKKIMDEVFGITDKPTSVREALAKVVTRGNKDIFGPDAASALALLDSAPFIKDTTIRIPTTEQDWKELSEDGKTVSPNQSHAAIYLGATNEILMNPAIFDKMTVQDLSDIVVHEATHAATARAVSFYDSYKHYVGKYPTDAINRRHVESFFEDLPSENRPTVDQALKLINEVRKADDIYRWLKKQKFQDGAYQMKNLDEFFSGVTSEPDFQVELAKMQLPENLRVLPRLSNIFSTLVRIIHRFLGGDSVKGNALESSTAALERVIMNSEPVSRQGSGTMSFGSNRYAAPATQAESDYRVKANYETEFAEHNSEMDFYDHVIGPLAQSLKTDQSEYLTDILGIHDPKESRDAVAERLQAQNLQVPVNDQMRLTDIQGKDNMIKARTDRDQITKKLIAAVQSGINKVTAKNVELKTSLDEKTRDLERSQNRLSKFDTLLHDITDVRDNALKTFKQSLRGTERNAFKLAELSARHDGLFGIAANLFGLRINQSLTPENAKLMVEAIREQTENFKLTDTLTAIASSDIDMDALAPRDIEAAVQKLYAKDRDPRLAGLADGSPKAKIDLALATYFAKTNPVDMAALEIRVEKDPKRKTQFIKAIKEVIRGNVTDASGLNDLLKDVRGGDVRVGKARKAVLFATQQLAQAKKALEFSKVQTDEMTKATEVLTEGLKPFQADLGILAGRFEPHDGAKYWVTSTTDGKPELGTLAVNETSSVAVVKALHQNIDWLKAHSNDPQDPTYLAIKDQIDGLKKVVEGYVTRPYRDSFLGRMFGSIPSRLEALGVPLARQAAQRYHDYFSKRQSQERLSSRGYQVTEAVKNAQKAVGFTGSYDGFVDSFWDPINHFTQHLQMLPSEKIEEQEAFAKKKAYAYMVKNDRIRDAISKPGAFDKLWDAVKTNAGVSSDLAKLAAKWKDYVEDDDIWMTDDRTGKIAPVLRPAMDVGLFTTQRRMDKGIGIKKTLLDKNPSWIDWSNVEGFDPVANAKNLFTPEIIDRFVKPFVNDTNVLHLDAPKLEDGMTDYKASPTNVQLAFDSAKGDMVQFASNLFDLEYNRRGSETEDADRKKYIEDTLGFFKNQYKKIENISGVQEQFNRRGLDVLSSPMMDNRKMEDFPPEFVNYRIYDPESLHQLVSSLAAHSAFGRDLGMFANNREVNGGLMWELAHTEETLNKDLDTLRGMKQAVLFENPRFNRAQVRAAITNQIGEQEYKRLDNVKHARAELQDIARDTTTYFTAPNGSTREMTGAQTVLGTIVNFMLNNFKTALNQSLIMFEPLMKYQLGPTAVKQVTRNFEAYSRSAMGSFVQSITGQAKLASEYAQARHEAGVGLDHANLVTGTQVLSNTGKDNSYEDRKLLSVMRKGRSLMFDQGFKATTPEERVAPAFRPWAPFNMLCTALNQASMEGEIRLYNDKLKQAVAVLSENPDYFSDPAFRFSGDQLGFTSNLDREAFKEFTTEFYHMGTTLETEARAYTRQLSSGQKLGDIILSPEFRQQIAARAEQKLTLESDISTSPSWLFTTKVGRLSAPLLTWSMTKMNQVIGSFHDVETGEVNKRTTAMAMATLAMGMVPASVAISILLDQYDENVLNKKSAMIGFNPGDAAQTAAALVERTSRVGTFGLAGDLVNGLRMYGTDGDNSALSFDQRVLFANTLFTVAGLVNTAAQQHGNLSYQTFYRPLMNAIGGGGILQDQQIINTMTTDLMGAPVFAREAEVTARLNALNYLRAGGRVLDMDVRTGSGSGAMSNPVKPYITAMVNATYGNNKEAFMEAYQKAIAEAQEEGQEDPKEFVKRNFQSYEPYKYVFRTPPSAMQISNLYGTMSDKGQTDVRQAISYFNAYGRILGITPYSGVKTKQVADAFSEPRQLDPFAQSKKTAMSF